MTPTSPPLMPRRSDSPRVSRSRPAKLTEPDRSAVTPLGSSPSGAMLRTVLPLPLSPTIASTSPSSTSYETWSAALTEAISSTPKSCRYTVRRWRRTPALSKAFCRRIGWFKPDGGLKDMMARVTMLAMHHDALIVLPTPKWRQNRLRPIAFTQATEPPLFPAPTTLEDARALSLRPIAGYNREGKQWNEFIARYHYLTSHAWSRIVAVIRRRVWNVPESDSRAVTRGVCIDAAGPPTTRRWGTSSSALEGVLAMRHPG